MKTLTSAICKNAYVIYECNLSLVSPLSYTIQGLWNRLAVPRNSTDKWKALQKLLDRKRNDKNE